MPWSDPYLIGFVMEKVSQFRPKTILDVGCGFGQYGVLLRNNIEVHQHLIYKKRDWKTRIDAVEIFKPYITPIHKYIYNNIYIQDIRKFKNINDYDMVIMCELIEHLPKKQGLAILKKIKNHYIITTPLTFSNDGSFCGNKYESHKSFYEPEDFPNFEFVNDSLVGWK